MLLGGKLSLGHSGKQLLTSRGAQLDLKLSEGNKLEVASEKIGSYPRGNFNAAPPPISLCAACDCPSSTNSSVPGNTDSAKRRGQEAGGRGSRCPNTCCLFLGTFCLQLHLLRTYRWAFLAGIDIRDGEKVLFLGDHTLYPLRRLGQGARGCERMRILTARTSASLVPPPLPGLRS